MHRAEEGWAGEWIQTQARAVEEKQGELKSLTDDELMRLGENLTVTVYEAEAQQAILFLAAYREVRRRAWSAGWFWKRWMKPGECEKWMAYLHQLDELARDATLKHFSDRGDRA